ncbi:TadE/TadG family type IV pilus assembly protein [Stieleria varia]|nr:Tad domain-containing protein [Stieleria varia]
MRCTSAQSARTLALGPLPELTSLVPASPRFARGGDGRGGYVMVLVAMMLFGLFAMAALVIDLGFARLAQRQMQSAADAAALEGLRGEGIVDFEDRQVAAEPFIAWTFADDLNLPIGNPSSVDFGNAASFSGGAGDPGLNASQLMAVDANHSTDVQRSSSPIANNRFSVAVQRGGVVDGDFELLAHGASVPYLFARGSLMDRGRVGNGIATGGVARAEPRPAVRVGPPVSTLPGVVPVAFALADWGASPSNPVTITSDISQGLSIGQAISVGGMVAPPPDGYCVIYEPVTSLVVGFGLLGQPAPVEGVVASRNATASLPAARDTLALLDATRRNAVLNTNSSLTHALNAPVLVRN